MSNRRRVIALLVIVVALGLGGGCLCKLTGDCIENLVPPSGPSPADGASEVPVTVTLAWNGGQSPNGATVRQDVYLSATSPPALYRPSVTGKSITVESLAQARTYYWQVVFIESDGRETRGPVWSFTTEFPPQFLSVVYPNWATSWSRGETRAVQWRSAYAGAQVRIELFKAGTNLCPIAEATPNDGLFEWTMSACADRGDANYRVKVTSLLDESLYDYSDFFTVNSPCPIQFTSPRKNDSWVAGEVRPVTWRPLDLSSGIKVSLHLYKGSDFRYIVSPITADDGAFDWIVSDFGGGSGQDYRIRINDLNQLGCSQFSDFFSIQACSVRVTAPATGDVWPLNTTQTITWDPTYFPETIGLELYHAGEYVCRLDNAVPNTGSYLWTVTRCTSLFGAAFQVKLVDGNDGPCGFSGKFSLH